MIFRTALFMLFLNVGISSGTVLKTDTFNICWYEGEIGQYQIRMFLKFSDTTVSGEYAYIKNDNSFDLTGRISKNKIVMTESFEKVSLLNDFPDFTTVKSGSFILEIKDSVLTGTWANAKKNSELPVRLFKKTSAKYIESDLVGVSRNKNPKYKVDTTFIEEYNQLQITEYRNQEVKKVLNEQLNSVEYAKLKLELEKVPGQNYIIDESIDSMIGNSDDPKELEWLHLPYDNSSISTVAYMDNNILSISNSENGYTGGAHPNGSVLYYNFDLKDGLNLSLKDIFNEGYKEFLDSAGEIYFRKKMGLKPDKSLSESGYWFEDDKFLVNDNFFLSAGGLDFYYNSYDIASYAQGPSEFYIPYHVLKPIINPDGPLGWVLKEP